MWPYADCDFFIPEWFLKLENERLFLYRIYEFGWKPDLKVSVEHKLEQVWKEHNTATVVSLHVRRTDYFVYLVSFYGAFHTANSSYYNNAMDYFRQVDVKHFPVQISKRVN